VVGLSLPTLLRLTSLKQPKEWQQIITQWPLQQKELAQVHQENVKIENSFIYHFLDQSTYMPSHTSNPITTFDSLGTNNNDLIRRVNEESRKRVEAENEKNRFQSDLETEKRKNVEKFNEIQKLKQENQLMQSEMKRVAQKLGGTFLPSESVLKTQKELILENQVKDLEERVEKLRLDKERL
jgi:hypothetical protein